MDLVRKMGILKILLLANQPERTTRLRMFMGTLKSQGHEVIVPLWNKKLDQHRQAGEEDDPGS